MTNQELRDLLIRITTTDRRKDRLDKVKGGDQQIVDTGLADSVGGDLNGEEVLKLLELAKKANDQARQEEIQKSGSSETEFDEFLKSLAQSVVATQKRLDKETATYLKEIEGQAHIQPTVFRMPKLEAQMKFGLDVRQGNKLNLMFWGKNSETIQQNQQGINFEIISVPAPPGAIESARRAVPQWTLVIDPLTRRDLIGEISQLEVTAQPKDPLAPVVGAASASPANIVLLDVGDATRYLVFYAEDSSDKDVGIWLLTLGSEGKPSELAPVYRFFRNNGDGEPLMQQLVLQLAAKQRKFLGK